MNTLSTRARTGAAMEHLCTTQTGWPARPLGDSRIQGTDMLSPPAPSYRLSRAAGSARQPAAGMEASTRFHGARHGGVLSTWYPYTL